MSVASFLHSYIKMIMIFVIEMIQVFSLLLLPVLEIGIVEKGCEDQVCYLDLPQGETNLQKLNLARASELNIAQFCKNCLLF